VGTDNYVELFLKNLFEASDTQHAYLAIIHELHEVLCKTQSGKKAFIQSGVFNMILDMCFQAADDVAEGTQINDMQRYERYEARKVALTLLVDFWKTKPELIQSRENRGRVADSIQQVLKKGARDRLKNLSVMSVSLMMSLLHEFAKQRNEYAPILYKSLTFILVESYSNLDLRQEGLHGFIRLFQAFQSMPIQILCDPLLKQIQLDLAKQEQFEGAQGQNILQPQSGFFTLNTTDFEFFLYVSVHPKLSVETAVQLLGIVLQISRKSIIFTRISLKLLLTLLNRYENSTQVFEHCQENIREVMRIIENQDGVKAEMYRRLIRDPRTKVHLKRRAAVSKSVNQPLEPRGSNALIVRNQDVQFLGVNASLAFDSSPIKGSAAYPADVIDDSDLQALLNPLTNPDDSSLYMQMLTNEKMIINQLQCLYNTGIKVLADFLRQMTVQCIVKIEKRHKLRNKGLLYLLSLYTDNVPSMLAMYQQDLVKQRTAKARQRAEKDAVERRQKTKEGEDYGIGPNTLEEPLLDETGALYSMDNLTRLP